MSLYRKEQSKVRRRSKWPLPFAIAVAVVVALTAAAIILLNRESPSRKSGRLVRHVQTAGIEDSRSKAVDRVRGIVDQRSGKRRKADISEAKKAAVDIFEGFTGKDRVIVERIQDALDNGDSKSVIKLVSDAMRNGNEEVRVRLVDALGWFGEEAMPELTSLLADSSQDVAGLAFHHWSVALSEVDNAQQRMEIGLSVLDALGDSDMRTSVVGEVSSAALEYIEGDGDDSDDARFDRRVKVVQELYDIIENSKSTGSDAAKQAYEDITGFAWLGQEEAERYLLDPQGYEPPDEEVGADSP